MFPSGSAPCVCLCCRNSLQPGFKWRAELQAANTSRSPQISPLTSSCYCSVHQSWVFSWPFIPDPRPAQQMHGRWKRTQMLLDKYTVTWPQKKADACSFAAEGGEIGFIQTKVGNPARTRTISEHGKKRQIKDTGKKINFCLCCCQARSLELYIPFPESWPDETVTRSQSFTLARIWPVIRFPGHCGRC